MLLLPPPPLPHAASAAPSSAAPALLLPIRCVSRLLPRGSTQESGAVKSRSGVAAAAVDNGGARVREAGRDHGDHSRSAGFASCGGGGREEGRLGSFRSRTSSGRPAT